MQRQSLGGSPLPKLQLHGGGVVPIGTAKDDPIASLSSPSRHPSDDDNHKSSKARPRRFSLSPRSSSPVPPPNHEKLVHLIPLLTLFCFLVLFLVSHTPSQSDLAQFKGLKRLSNPIDSSDAADDVSTLTQLRSSKVLGVRSLSSLPVIHGDNRAARGRRSHRKLADF